MSRKREKPYLASQSQRPRPKRARSATPVTPESTVNDRVESSVVIVSGLLSGCTVLELKSRFEMFGPISRLRIDQTLSLGYVTFRSRGSAEAAIAAAVDPSCGITIRSSKVQVSWSNDLLPQWRAGVRASSNNDRPSSKLLRAEIPLSRHGRGIKKLGIEPTGTAATKSGSDLPFKGREIIAYDDLL